MKNIIIIGAGPAGLTAAYELLKEKDKYKVTVLESSSEIGGISRTVNVNNNRMDIGGHRFFTKDERIAAWWNEIMPMQGAPSMDDKILNRHRDLSPDGPDPEQADRVMLVRDRVSRIYYGGKFFDYPVSMKWETIRNMGFLTTLRAGLSYLFHVIYKLPEDSLENFYINRFGKVLYSMFFEKYTEKVWGRHPRDISADWGSQRVKGLSIIVIFKDILRRILPGKNKAAVETSLIEQFSYPKYGPGHLWETVAGEIIKMGGTIEMECPVTAITVKGEKIESVTCQKDETDVVFPLDICISSMPIKDLIHCWNGTDIPKSVKETALNLPYRDFVTVGLLVPKLNLINKTKHKTLNDIIPDCWIYVQDASVRVGRIQIFNNWSPYMVEKPMETVWIGLEYFCNEGDEFWSMSDEACISFAQNELVSMKIINRGCVMNSHVERVKKAYPAYFDSYYNLSEVVEYLNQYDNLYCVGRNGQHRYNNMDHSMATSFEAVDHIRSGCKDKGNIWNVNVEKLYHEGK